MEIIAKAHKEEIDDLFQKLLFTKKYCVLLIDSLDKYHMSPLCNEQETIIRLLGIRKETLN